MPLKFPAHLKLRPYGAIKICLLLLLLLVVFLSVRDYKSLYPTICNTMVLLCSLAVLDLKVGHTMDVLSPFVPVLRKQLCFSLALDKKIK